MNHVKLLDCTLRDGAYLIDKKFGDPTIKGIVNKLVKAKVDYIEVGFFQDDEFGEGKTVFRNSAHAKQFIPEDRGNCEFTVLADYSRFSVSNLDERIEGSVDAVRECFFKHERYDAIKACYAIKEKGYKVFVQPVDILGYTDIELIELLHLVNELEPYCLSIVDTFGSMYQEDLHRVFELINHNLIPTCRMGFHSHNNMQLSNALTQEFIRMTVGKREVVVDGTVNGMGRGAGNAPTELIAQYLVSQLDYKYELDAILDITDVYMNNIRSKCTWGYTIPNFVAGCYSAHVNNIQYLMKKNSMRAKDMRYILNKIGAKARKRYDYEKLEETYMEYLESDIQDDAVIAELNNRLQGKDVLLLAPGYSATTEVERIQKYIKEYAPVVISINYVHDKIESDLVYMSNVKRYNYWKNHDKFQDKEKILVSTIKQQPEAGEHIVSFKKLIKCGWENLDNAAILLLRLLDNFSLNSIAIAGFDGYACGQVQAVNYASSEMELFNINGDPKQINKEIASMLADYRESRVHNTPVRFITSSRFEDCM